MPDDQMVGVDFARAYWRKAVPSDLKLKDSVTSAPDETELRLLADNLPSLCWIADGDGSISWYNQRWHNYCGSTPEAMSGWGWQSVHDTAILPEVMQRWTSSIAAGEAFEMTFPLKGADGIFRPFLTRVTPLKSSEGRVLRWFGNNTDVTQQRETEAALQESESYVRLLLNTSAEAFYAVDRDGVTTLCNAAFVTMMGFADANEAIGRKLHDVIHHTHPDGAHYDVADCPIYRCASDGTSAHVTDELFYRLDGTPVPVEYWAKPITFEGEHRGAICTFIDITERLRARAKLIASEAEFRTFAQAMPHQVWASQPDGLLDWFNERVYDYGGYVAGELVGNAWAAMVHPEDARLATERWGAALASGERYETEFRLRRADGTYRWHLARAVPIRAEDGSTTRWIGTNTDIDDQKCAAAALANLNATLEQEVAQRTADRDRVWRNSQDLIVIVDPLGSFRDVSPSVTATLGWLPEEWIGRPLFDFLVPDDGADTGDALRRAAQKPLQRFENRYRHKDGGYRWFSWVATPAEGLIYATGRDVTVEKEAAAELAKAQEALRQSQKMEAVGQLTGGIAHDFNNMLAVVLGSLELLGRRLSGGDARAQRYIDAATDASRRAALLTQRLLAFSRQQPLQPEAIEANTLVSGMSDLLRHSLGAEVQLETVLAGGLWRTHADPNQLENIILNLAVNARDAMPDGGHLTIETQNAHLDERYAAANLGVTAGQYVLIAVTDTGTGMPAAVVEKAFDPFFTTKPVGKGTGLGLSQVYGFVKQSGGHVKIYTEEGLGTTIKIYLPRLRGETPRDTAEEQSVELARGEDREVILVVEDESSVRQFSVDALTELGYHVLESDGGAKALQLLGEHPEIVLMFTDVVMPGMNGAKLAEAARGLRPDLKILFTTGYTRNAVVHNGKLDEGVDLIGKPFSLEALAAKIRAVLEAR
ncbi:PAS domain S-box protein [Sphingomonas sp. UYP23]